MLQDVLIAKAGVVVGITLLLRDLTGLSASSITRVLSTAVQDLSNL